MVEMLGYQSFNSRKGQVGKQVYVNLFPSLVPVPTDNSL